MRKISQRALVRIITFTTALVISLGCLWGIAEAKNQGYQQEAENTYLRSIEDLYTSLTNISSTLTKGVYCSSPAMLSTLSSKLWREASLAKVHLSELPINYFKLENTYKFLSQVGDYAISLARQSAEDANLSEEEIENLRTLNQYCNELLVEVRIIEQAVTGGSIDISRIQSDLSNMEGESDAPSITDGFEDFEEGYSSFPTLIYDGPFSDHILQQEARMLEGQETITREQARKIAAIAMNVDISFLEDGFDEEGKMPSYGFQTEDKAVRITKAGGFISYYVSSRSPQETTLSVEEAQVRAEEYLLHIGATEMVPTYYEIGNNTVIFNFAYKANDIIYYPDLIKVSVALDNGEVLGCNQRGYLMNHHIREFSSTMISLEEAQSHIASNLTIQKAALAVIPTSGSNEVLTYEFQCTGYDDQQILMYINVETGEEEEILILLISDEGTLTI